nr:reverse transcriptase domain-containing protein [Tanacetum cinerariifolium]
MGIRRVVPRNYDPKGKRNIFPPLDNPELTIRRRSRTDPTLLNNYEMAAEGPGDLPVPDLRTMEELCQPSLNGRGGPIAPIAIQATKFGLKNDMIQQLRNEITNFCQLPDESLFEAWAHYKLSIDGCPNHNLLPFTQIDTFYNGLTLRHRDTINAAAGGTFMKRRPKECYDLIENMTAYHNDWDTSAQRSESSSSITSSFDTEIAALKAEMAEIKKNLMRILQVNQQVKEVTSNCETSGGPHSFSDCPAIVGNTQNVYVAEAYQGIKETIILRGTTKEGTNSSRELTKIRQPQVVTTNEFTNFMKANDAILKNMQTNITSLTNSNLELKNMFGNTITNPKKDLKGITTRSGTAYQGPTIPTTSSSSPVVERETEATKDTMHPTNNGSTEDVQPSVMAECLALADLGASINLMPLPVWNKLSLPDFNADPRVPLILGRSFLKIGRALIDVFESELILRVGKQAITFNLDQTSRYSANYNDLTANRIDNPIVSTTSPTVTPFGNSDFLLEEFDAFLALEDDPASPEVDQSYVDTEGDILLLVAFLNDDPSLPSPNQGNYMPQVQKELKICKAKTNKSSIDEPPEVELKD